MEELIEQFSKAAIEKFGDKFYVGKLTVDKETLNTINLHLSLDLTQKDFDDYGDEVWLKEPICPNCGADLLGLFGYFEWDLQHGYGHCASCNTTTFKYYHYINKYQLKMMSLVEF